MIKRLLTFLPLTAVLVFSMVGWVAAFENFVVNGTTYTFPDVDDTAWGQNVTDWAQAITNNILYKKGGNFPLTGEAVLGSTYGVTVAYVRSTGTALGSATTGFVRMTSGSSVAWRNEEGTADLFLVLGASNSLIFNGAKITTGAASDISSALAIIDLLRAATAEVSVQESPDIGNLTYYLHDETTGYGSLYRLLSSSPSVDPEVARTVNVAVASNLVRLSSHVTVMGDPGVTKLPAGVWSFTSWVGAASLLNNAQLVVTVSTLDTNGNSTEIVSSTSPSILEVGSQRFDMVAVQPTDLFISTSQRLVVQYFARTTSAIGINITLYYAGTTRFTHMTAPLGAVFKFPQLSDVPQSYAGQAGKYVTVNSTETALQFTTLPASGGSNGTKAVYVGTLTAVGVDIASSNFVDALNAAFDRIGARGLTASATAQGRIVLGPGSYFIPTISSFTIPAGVRVDGVERSTAVVLVTTNVVSGNLVNVYGTLNGANFDLQSQSISGLAVRISSGGTVSNCRIMRGGIVANQASQFGEIGVINSSGASIINVTLDNSYEVGQYQDTSGGLMIRSSTNTLVEGFSVSSVQNQFGGGGIITVQDGTATIFRKCYFPATYGNFMTLGGSRWTQIIDSDFYQLGTSAGAAILLQSYLDTTMHVDSNTITNCRFYNGNTSASTIMINTISPHLIYGNIVENCKGFNLAGASASSKFAVIAGATNVGNMFTGNKVSGMGFITDSGTLTRYTTLGNFKDYVQQ